MQKKEGINARTNATMEARLHWLRRWLYARNYDLEEKTRKDFLRIYYCTLCALYECEDAQNFLISMNEKLLEPYPKIRLKQMFKLKTRWYKDQTIIDKLGITEEEKARFKIGENVRIQQEREARKAAKEKLYQEILDYCDFYPYTIDELHEVFPEVSKSTIQRITAKIRRSNRGFLEIRVLDAYRHGMSVKQIAENEHCGKDKIYSILGFGKKPDFTIEEELSTKSELDITFRDSSLLEIFSLHRERCIRSSSSDDEAIPTIKLLHTGVNTFITGSGGTGKSYIIGQYLKSLSKQERKNTLLVAPTWKSASHIGGTTIHRAFHLDIGVLANESVSEVSKSLLNINRIIIDEISMVRIDIFTRVINIIKFIEETQDRHIQIVVVGDFGQIEPVATKEERSLLKEYYPDAEDIYAFNSECWNECNFKTVSLVQIHRQHDPELIEKLTETKYGAVSTIQWFNDNLSHVEDESAVYICPTLEMVNKYNYQAIEKYSHLDKKRYVASIIGETAGIEFPCPSVLDLAVGMHVMAILNTKEHKNGEQGVVTAIGDGFVEVAFGKRPACKVTPKKMTLDNRSIFEQLPLVLGYAMTANKSEGIELDAVNIIPGYFAPGQLYVALTRCKNREGIHLIGKLRDKDLVVNINALRMTV